MLNYSSWFGLLNFMFVGFPRYARHGCYFFCNTLLHMCCTVVGTLCYYMCCIQWHHGGVDKRAAVRSVSSFNLALYNTHRVNCTIETIEAWLWLLRLLVEARLLSACKSLGDLMGLCWELGLSLLEAAVGACSCHTSLREAKWKMRRLLCY